MIGKPPLADGSQQASSITPRRRRHSEPPTRSKALHVPSPELRRGSSTTLAEWTLSVLKGKKPEKRVVRKVVKCCLHLYRSIPVMVVHGFCDMQCQLMSAPLLYFADFSSRGRNAIRSYLPSHSGASNLFSADVPYQGYLLVAVRLLATLLHTYAKDMMCMDASVVVRQLRSQRRLNRLLGWALRFSSHVLLDSPLLSIVSSVLAVTVKDYSTKGLVRFTLPGLCSGICLSAAAVAVDQFIMPGLSLLMNRAVSTVFEATEYVIQRRYTYVDPTMSVPPSSSVSEGTPAVSDSEAESDTAVSERRAGEDASSEADKKDNEEDEMAAAIRRQEKIYERVRREKRQALRRAQAAQEAREHAALVRAFMYCAVSAFVAQCVVSHPLRMLVEVLRGRAVMHATGLLGDESEWNTVQSAYGVSARGLRNYLSNIIHSGEEDVPLVVSLLRRSGAFIGREWEAVFRSIAEVSGEAFLLRNAFQSGASTDSRAFESIFLAVHSFLGFRSLYRGVGFTVLRSAFSLYVEKWLEMTD